MRGVFLHVLADTLSSVGVIVSALLIKYKGWNSADPVCSVFISLLILLSVIPLLQNTGKTLALHSSGNEEQDRLVQELLMLPEVRSIRDPHTWTVSGSLSVCSVRVLVDPEASEQRTLISAARICNRFGYRDMTIQVEKPEYSGIHAENFVEILSGEKSGGIPIKHALDRGRRGRRVAIDKIPQPSIQPLAVSKRGSSPPGYTKPNAFLIQREAELDASPLGAIMGDDISDAAYRDRLLGGPQ